MTINISTSSRVFWWKPAAWLRVCGDDAATFLQGQFTNDLRALDASPAVYGLWLTVKGKVLADSFVLRGASKDEFWIGSYFSPATVIQQRLESHVIADDVTIEDATTAWLGLSLIGDGGGQLEAESPGAGFAFRGRRTREGNSEWIFPASEAVAARSRLLGATELTADEIAHVRITAGIPAVPQDIGPGDLPNEGGLDAGAISFTKGCYLGQEVMARLKSMGQVRRQLLRVHGRDDAIPTLPARVFVQGRAVGELRSATPDPGGGFIGLAMVSLLHATAGAEFALAVDAPPVLRLIEAP